MVAISSVLLGDTIGFAWGVASGYLGGRADLLSQRVLDVLMSLPALILALLLMAALGAGLSTVIIAIAVTRVPLSTRVVRSMVLSVKELSYVEAARMLGTSGARVMARHVASQCVAPFLIITTGHLGAAIFIEAALSFVGVGVPPPMPSWGNMQGGVLAEAFKPPWWMVVFPGTAITVIDRQPDPDRYGACRPTGSIPRSGRRTSGGSTPPSSSHVAVHASRELDEAVIRVRDNGIGIPGDLLPRVFDLFTQGDRSLAYSGGGLGVGLTIVKKLVELHGGTITAESEGPERRERVYRPPASSRRGSGPDGGREASSGAEAPAGRGAHPCGGGQSR